jgi:hypothetical protein
MQHNETPEILAQLQQETDALTQSFTRFGIVAADALKGIAAAATLAAQNSAALQSILQDATNAALADGTKKLSMMQQINSLQLKEIESFEQQSLDLQTRYQAMGLKQAETTAAEKKKIINSEFTAAKEGADALMSLADMLTENGKKNTDAQKAAALLKIGIDTARAISSLVAASNENPANAATSGIAGAVQFAAGLAQIVTNIAKAKEILTGGDTGGNTGAPALSNAAAGINTNAPVIAQPPQQDNGIGIDRSTQGNTRQTGMIKAYVVETEITRAQQRASSLKRQSFH